MSKLYPLAGIAFSKELDGWPPGSSIGTFRGNNPAFASGIEALKTLSNEDTLAHVRQEGERILNKLRESLKESPIVCDIRGQGFMLGIEICNPTTKNPDSELAKKIALLAFKSGVIVEIGGRSNNVIRLLPALNIGAGLLDRGLEILTQTIHVARVLW